MDGPRPSTKTFIGALLLFTGLRTRYTIDSLQASCTADALEEDPEAYDLDASELDWYLILEAIDLLKHIETLLTLEQKSPKFDLLGYWKSSVWPNLTNLALRYHSIPSSSAPSERSFSQCNLVLTAHRNRLTVEHARMLCTIAVLRR